MGEVRFMISEAAKQVDVESHVLRYWEEELGLTIGRTEMGHRFYTKDDIRLFCCIKKLKDEGMLLRDLKPLIPELKETRLKLMPPEAAPEHTPAVQAPSIQPSAGQAGEGQASSSQADAAQPASVSLPKTAKVPPSVSSEAVEVVIPIDKVEQMRALVGEVFREALAENNGILKNDISSTVTTDVIHEMDFLLQAKERQQEEHFRKLDTLIRQQQTTRKESAKGNPIMKLRRLFT